MKFLFYSLLSAVFLIHVRGAEPSWAEKSLIKDLLKDYEKRARPVVDGVSKTVELGTNHVQQITIDFGLALIQILELNENKQILTVSVKLLYRWQDHHLIWNPEDYENITSISVPTSKIWIPDIALYNYADERLEEQRTCAARVDHNGTIEWYPMAIYKSTCPVKIKYFPYDRQHCVLRFGPWTYDSARVNTTLYYEKIVMDDYSKSPEWELVDHNVNVSQRRYACCPEVYTDMLFHIYIKRQPAYYNYLLILPCFLLSALTLVVFWLPPETPAKMVLGMNIYVAFFLLLMLLKDSIPSASSSFPLIGNYYAINMVLVTASTFMCLIVVNIHYRGDRLAPVPEWVRKLVNTHGARLLLVQVNPPNPPSTPSPTKKPSRSGQHPGTPLNCSGRMPFAQRTAQFGQHPRSGTQLVDIPNYAQLQTTALDPRFQNPHDYSVSHRPDRNPTVQRYSPGDAVPFYNMPMDYTGQRTPYGEQLYLDWSQKQQQQRVGVDDPNRVCSFCPACAGLAAAAAATGIPDEDVSDDLEVSQRVPQGSGHIRAADFGRLNKIPPQPYVQDPTEQLAAVWAAAMNGTDSQDEKPNAIAVKPVAYNQAGRIRPDEADEEDDDEADDVEEEDVDEEDEEEDDEQLNTFDLARDRSIGLELESFLFECVRPQSGTHVINAANARWTGRNVPPPNTQAHVPSSPFYRFSSPHCDEDVDDSSGNGWTGAVDRGQLKPNGPPLPDGTTQCAQCAKLPGKTAQRVVERKIGADRGLLRRVQRVRRDVAEIVRCIRYMRKINENKERINKVIAEWRLFGMVLDRLFFVIYLCTLGVSLIMYFPRSASSAEEAA